jgi:hypothetical protein
MRMGTAGSLVTVSYSQAGLAASAIKYCTQTTQFLYFSGEEDSSGAPQPVVLRFDKGYTTFNGIYFERANLTAMFAPAAIGSLSNPVEAGSCATESARHFGSHSDSW